MRYRTRNLQSFGATSCLFDSQSDHMLNALAVGNDLFGE
jgi:hypothetical protein